MAFEQHEKGGDVLDAAMKGNPFSGFLKNMFSPGGEGGSFADLFKPSEAAMKAVAQNFGTPEITGS